MKPIKTKIKISKQEVKHLAQTAMNLDYVVYEYYPESAIFLDEEKGINHYNPDVSPKLGLGVVDEEKFLPESLNKHIRSTLMIKSFAGDFIPTHKDKSRHCSMYCALHPEENYSPYCSNGLEIGYDNHFWLVDLRDWHGVDNTNGPDRYNIQIVFNKSFQNISTILKKEGIIE